MFTQGNGLRLLFRPPEQKKRSQPQATDEGLADFVILLKCDWLCNLHTISNVVNGTHAPAMSSRFDLPRPAFESQEQAQTFLFLEFNIATVITVSSSLQILWMESFCSTSRWSWTDLPIPVQKVRKGKGRSINKKITFLPIELQNQYQGVNLF